MEAHISAINHKNRFVTQLIKYIIERKRIYKNIPSEMRCYNHKKCLNKLDNVIFIG